LNSALPLSDLKVIEFTHMVMGPTTGAILADLGADVLKVEPAAGDNTRRLKGSGGGYFPMYNRNKRSLAVDLKSDEGKALVRKLIDEADVLIENFRPGAMDKLGFGYDALSARNPRLIYCSLKGFLSGPYEQRTALDEVTQMMGGLAYMTGLPDRPMRAGSSVIDISGGMFGVIGILAAVNERHRTGAGQAVTSSLFETTAFMVGQHMAQQESLGEEPPPMSVRRSAWGVYDLFPLADGERLFVAVVSDTQWALFLKEFALAELAADESLKTNAGRVAGRDKVIPALEALFSRLSPEEAMAKLERAGLPFAAVNKPSDLFDDPQMMAGGLMQVALTDGPNAGGAARIPKLPLEMNGRRMNLEQDLPGIGEHSLAAARQAGYGEDTIEALVAQGVIVEKPSA
jgi:crotonobetainyl-CoA:carnitine CoA-transferase CaiB-like acyl-CoA transferase